jgi:carboxyl-terminal processing protease
MKYLFIKQNRRTALYSFISLILLGGVFGIGFYFGYAHKPASEKVLNISNKDPLTDTSADFNSFWKVWNMINEKSIYAKKVSDQDRVWGAIKGMASSLGDPYTVFFPPQENKLFNEEIRGSFSGIGAEIGMKDKIITVVSPIKNSPAANAGLKAGDKILKIDKTETNDITVDKAISLIRGKKGTEVVLTIFRSGEKTTREIKIIRDDISLPTIDTELRPDNIFVIKFYSFSENSSVLFSDALSKFIKSGSHKLVLDMRGNPGGYLDAAVNIGSWFIDEGKTIVSEDFGSNRKPIIYRSHGPRLFSDNFPFVVLVDSGSASAAEILSGALKEYKIATIVGQKTFGKGSVQELLPVTDDTSLKVTVARWLTPNGLSISEHGLEPDVVVPITMKDIEAKKDPQMDKAVEILTAKP